MTFGTSKGGGGGCNTKPQRKVMIVAEPTRESATALRYVLSHVVRDSDKLYLLHVENPSFWKNKLSYLTKQSSVSSTARTSREDRRDGDGDGDGDGCVGCIGGNGDFLDQMKHACEIMHPKLKVIVSKVEMGSNDKVNVIISQTKVQGIDLLVVGKRQTLSNAILGQRINVSIRGGETAEYLVENSKCTCVAVQRKGPKGGFLLHTKTHRNYWLLA